MKSLKKKVQSHFKQEKHGQESAYARHVLGSKSKKQAPKSIPGRGKRIMAEIKTKKLARKHFGE